MGVCTYTGTRRCEARSPVASNMLDSCTLVQAKTDSRTPVQVKTSVGAQNKNTMTIAIATTEQQRFPFSFIIFTLQEL
ncbi:hypothetical protein E2562_005008 [Oryza meyeriana var. granulata]|uniref:Uncharacterized protein n=1 Tax=Oryza meyeriana var. granulata TaxID=110450 RepID=A0A6G1C4R1_9ORYZ|nr:hypothetical protein E2562_005008 [Oryza meyeriana var. granulata]